MNLGKSLNIALVKKGMKKKELAEKLGVGQPLISTWASKGSMTRANLEKICEVLDMPVSEFVALGEN